MQSPCPASYEPRWLKMIKCRIRRTQCIPAAVNYKGGNFMWWLVSVLIIAPVLTLYACCRVAGDADRQAERLWIEEAEGEWPEDEEEDE